MTISNDEILQKTVKRIWRDEGNDLNTCPVFSWDRVKELDPSIFEQAYNEHITPIELLFMNRLDEIRHEAQEISAKLPRTDKPEREELETKGNQLLESAHALETAHIELVGALVHLKEHKLIERSVSVFYKAYELAKKYDPTLTNPVRLIAKAVLDANPPSVDIETRQEKILPNGLRDTSATETQERLAIGDLHPQGTDLSPQQNLPGIPVRDKVIVPALPLDVYHRGDDESAAQRGAPLSERLWMNFILDVPISCRLFTTGVKITPTLKEIVDHVFPNGWNRTVQLPRLIRAFDRLHQKRISWERRGYNIVQVFASPQMNTALDDTLEIIVRFPPGFTADRGPKIDTEQMNLNGLKSAIMFRICIRLPYFWDSHKSPLGDGKYANIYATRDQVLRHPTLHGRNGEHYLTHLNGEVILSGKVYYKNGHYHAPKGNQPQTVWYHPWATVIGEERNPQADNVPVFTADDLIHLGFNNKEVNSTTRRKRIFYTRKALDTMAEEEQLVIEENAIDIKTGVKGFRILQPRP